MFRKPAAPTAVDDAKPALSGGGDQEAAIIGAEVKGGVGMTCPPRPASVWPREGGGKACGRGHGVITNSPKSYHPPGRGPRASALCATCIMMPSSPLSGKAV